MIHITMAIMTAMPTTPPTTAPAMTPAFEEEEDDESGREVWSAPGWDVAAGPEVATLPEDPVLSEVVDGPGAVASPAQYLSYTETPTEGAIELQFAEMQLVRNDDAGEAASSRQ